ncbi:MAG: glycosyltransferase [Elusimicrobiota bacterium]
MPTYQESANLPALCEGLKRALDGTAYEIIVVDDDSPDGTSEAAARIAQDDSRLTVLIRREKPRDLARSVALGFSAARGTILASLNADGSHDPADLPRLLAAIAAGAEVAIGSRYVAGGRVENWPWRRRILSWAGTLAPRGFKVLLEVLARGRPRAVEVPIVFRDRVHGTSKLSWRAAWLALAGLIRLIKDTSRG